jgi:Glycosyl hydrolases family 43
VAHTFRRIITALLAVFSVLAFSAACVPTGTPLAPTKDAIPSNGVAGDHGWFQAGHQWVGDFGDPDILRVGNTYYAYSSGAGGRYLSVLTSTDLTHWTIHPNWNPLPSEIVKDAEKAGDKANNNDALVKPASWGLNTPVNAWLTKTYWASSVIQIGSTWYAYSAVKVGTVSDDPHGYGRFCLTVASGPSPLGPFRDTTTQPIQCQPATHDPAGSIDPYPYHDAATNKNYLLWKAAGKVGVRESALMSVELGSDGKPKAGAAPVTLLQTSRTRPWEGSTIENPAMVSFHGATYLFYSANDSISDAEGRSNYATGYAICTQGPRAACVRMGTQPLLASSGTKQGPGGASPVVDASGTKLRLAYATYWLGENRNGYHPRRLQITGLVQYGFGALRVG